MIRKHRYLTRPHATHVARASAGRAELASLERAHAAVASQLLNEPRLYTRYLQSYAPPAERVQELYRRAANTRASATGSEDTRGRVSATYRAAARVLRWG